MYHAPRTTTTMPCTMHHAPCTMHVFATAIAPKIERLEEGIKVMKEGANRYR
jgi:hypothetical protein